jgi:hypothetical protein
MDQHTESKKEEGNLDHALEDLTKICAAGSETEEKDALISTLKAERDALKSTVNQLRSLLIKHENHSTPFFSSSLPSLSRAEVCTIPQVGLPAGHVTEIINSFHLTDFQPMLNTSSYVNVVSEHEERRIAALGSQINLADASVYPSSVKRLRRPPRRQPLVLPCRHPAITATRKPWPLLEEE